MALTQLGTPYPVFTDLDGTPLDGGYVYFGVIDENPETSPITVYYDPGLTQPAAQPLRTSNGYVMRNGSPAILYAGSLFSVTLRNKNSALVVYAQAGYGVSPYEIAGPASAEVVIVAGIAANVTTVAGVASDVAALGPIASDITAAVSNAANITTVAGISGDVTIVADNVTDVTTFAKVYLGGKATAPTVRNDGGALQEGDLYFNTASDNLFVWGGAAWLPAVFDVAGAMFGINNLSDVASASASLANLGLTATAAELNQIDGKTVIGTDANITTTPAYSGQALKYLRVNAGETAAEFAAIPTPVELSQVQAEDDTSTVFGQVSGERLAQAVAANAGTDFGAVGTYVFGWVNTTNGLDRGESVAGSALRPAAITQQSTFVVTHSTQIRVDQSIYASAGTDAATLSGTWQHMGETTQTTTVDNTPHSLFIRIA